MVVHCSPMVTCAARIGVAIAVVPYMLAGCGSSGGSADAGGVGTGPGSASATGTIGGRSVPDASALAILQSQPGNACAAILLSSDGSACGDLLARHVPGGTSNLSYLFCEVGNAVTPGTYPLGPHSQAQSGFVVQDSQCHDVVNVSASSGSVTLTSADASSLVGTFDLTFPGGDHVTGSFTAPVCPVSTTADAGSTVCGP